MIPLERWERIAWALLLCAGFFLAFTIDGIRQHDDAGGLAMTIAPMLLCLAGWRFAAWRRDR